jgi:UDP-glucose 4-epimerase
LSNKKILIIGGAGYIGSHVTLEFCKHNYEVVVFDNLSTGHKSNVDSRAEFIEGSILNLQELNDLFKKVNPSTVIHLAALKAAGESMVEPMKYSETNIKGSINVLNMMMKYNVKNLIFSSTAAVYGAPQYLPINELHPLIPVNYYGFTKKSIEDYIQWYAELKGLRYSILRYFNAAGYDMNGEIIGLEKEPQNLLPIVMEVIMGERAHLNIFGNDYNTNDGTCERDYIHVSDLASAHLLSEKKLADSQENFIINLATGKKYSVLEVVNGCKSFLSEYVNHKFVDRRLGDPELLYSESKLAFEKLGWKPQFSNLESILKSMYDVYKVN